MTGSHHQLVTAAVDRQDVSLRSPPRVPPIGHLRSPLSSLVGLSLCLVAALVPGTAQVHAAPANAAGFETNFDTSAFGPTNAFYTGNAGCGFAQGCGTTSNLSNGDPTPFYQQVVDINGTSYFHVMVGDPASGFAEESYTPFAAGNGSADGTSLQGDNNPFGAGNEMSVLDPTWSSSPGHSTPSRDYNLLTSVGNVGNPLDTVHKSGNGGGDPTHAVFRMVLTSSAGDMSMDVVKPFLDKKPRISQTVQDGTLSSQFVADMTKLSYSDDKTPAEVKIHQVISDSSIPGIGAGDFNMSQAQQSYVTAGRYTFTPGTGWNNATGWDSPGSSFDLGTYTYEGGQGFDPFTVNWATFFKYDQNATACVRSNPLARNSEGAGGVGSCPGGP